MTTEGFPEATMQGQDWHEFLTEGFKPLTHEEIRGLKEVGKLLDDLFGEDCLEY